MILINWQTVINLTAHAFEITGHMRRTGCYVALITLFLINTSGAQTSTITLSSEKQSIRGFGGMNFPRWISDLTTDQIEKAFGVGDGKIGMSILRISIAPDSTYWYKEVTTAKIVTQQYGGILLGTPWSPPASMKSNSSTVKGELNAGSYAAYAEYLTRFYNYMKANNAEMYAISIQNEPDWEPDYEGCKWSPAQILNFMKNNAGSIPGKVAAAEALGFNKAYTDPVLNDATAAANIDIVAGHLYGATPSDYPLARNQGKEIWMTEHITSSDTTANVWPSALGIGTEIHKCMTNYFNAYIWWYIRRSYGMLTEDGNVSKRGYVMSHYARFVRPGWIRVDATESPATGLYVSAYKNGNDITLVVINTNTSANTIQFSIPNTTVKTLTKYTTSSGKSVANDGTVSVSNSAVSVSFDASSITTLTGTGSSTAIYSTKISSSKSGITFNKTAKSVLIKGSGIIDCSVFDLKGTLVEKISGHNEITTGKTLHSGMYIIKAAAKGQLQEYKFVK